MVTSEDVENKLMSNESTLEWNTVLYAVARRGVAPPLLTMRTRAAPIRAQ